LAEKTQDSDDLHRIQGLEGLLAVLLAQWDGAASGRARAIDLYTAAIKGSLDIVPESLQSELSECLQGAGQSEADLRVSALEARLDVLRAAIIPLQTWLETTQVTGAETVLAEVWQAEYHDATSRISFEHLF
jgi:hypothetical protein